MVTFSLLNPYFCRYLLWIINVVPWMNAAAAYTSSQTVFSGGWDNSHVFELYLGIQVPKWYSRSNYSRYGDNGMLGTVSNWTVMLLSGVTIARISHNPPLLLRVLFDD
ncbi:hypothetical protein FXO37_22946 [Capsicum annuum]|nr:hypothetical protein FXO37_22946 [Capsicum annuum]